MIPRVRHEHVVGAIHRHAERQVELTGLGALHAPVREKPTGAREHLYAVVAPPGASRHSSSTLERLPRRADNRHDGRIRSRRIAARAQLALIGLGAMAFGFLYFTVTGLTELVEHRWAQSGIPAQQSKAA